MQYKSWVFTSIQYVHMLFVALCCLQHRSLLIYLFRFWMLPTGIGVFSWDEKIFLGAETILSLHFSEPLKRIPRSGSLNRDSNLLKCWLPDLIQRFPTLHREREHKSQNSIKPYLFLSRCESRKYLTVVSRQYVSFCWSIVGNYMNHLRVLLISAEESNSMTIWSCELEQIRILYNLVLPNQHQQNQKLLHQWCITFVIVHSKRYE